MRLAIVTTNRNYPWGGAEHLWHDLALAARARGWPVLAIAGPLTLDSAPIRQLQEAGVTVVGLPVASNAGGGRLARLYRFTHRLIGTHTTAGRALRHFAPDLIFVNQCGAFDGAWEYWLQGVIRAQEIPYATISHNNNAQPLNPAEREACRQWSYSAQALFFVSAELQQLAESQLGQSLPRGAVVQNPFPLPAADHLPPWPQESPWRLAVVGRLEIHEKGLDLILSSLARVLGGEKNWQLSFYGRGPDEARLQTEIAAHGLTDRVSLAGYAAQPTEIWRHHHLGLLASRWEGFSLVMAEALACGRPVLRTRSGGASWIDHGQTGWLCAPDNATDFANTLRAAWERRDDWRNMGIAARASVLKRADPAPVNSLLNHLERITA